MPWLDVKHLPMTILCSVYSHMLHRSPTRWTAFSEQTRLLSNCYDARPW